MCILYTFAFKLFLKEAVIIIGIIAYNYKS
jgi:hypothetical protein